jgi:O-antigen/teichoic acid export membrane protein
MSKGLLLAKNTLILSFGKFSNQLITLCLLPVYTSYLAPSEYGLLELALTYTALLAPILSMQLETTAFRYLIDTRDNVKLKKQIISYTFKIISLASVAFVLVMTPILYVLNIKYGYLIIFNIVTSIYLSLFMQYARGLGRNGIFTLASISTSIILLGYTIFSLLILKQGLMGIFIAIALSNIVGVIYIYFTMNIGSYFINEKNVSLQKEMFKFTTPLIPNSASWWVIGASDKTIVAIILGLSANGIYTVSAKYSAILSSIFIVFGLALTESITMHIDSIDSSQFITNIFNLSLKFFAGLGMVLIAACPYVFRIFIGEEYRSAELYVPLLVTAAVFSVVVGIYSSVYVAKRDTKKIVYANASTAIINILLTLLLIRFIGIFAAALATLLSYMLVALFRYSDIKRYVDIRIEKYLLLKISLAYSFLFVAFYCGSDSIRAITLLLSLIGFLLLNLGLVKLFTTYMASYKKVIAA